MYLDLNNNSRLDTGEQSTTTSAAGIFSFADVPAGQTPIIRQILPSGYIQTSPANGYGIHLPTIAAGGAYSNENFVDAAAGATISGSVTANGQPVAGETIYLDANNNSKLDSGELSTTTTASGSFSFADVPAGAFIIRQILPTGYQQATPSNEYGIHITLTAGSTRSGENFTDTAPTGSIAGTVFNDANGDGIQDNGETGLAGWTLYIDLNNSGSYISGDPTATTDSAGDYLFSGLAPGTYIVRAQRPSGYSQTTPTNNFGHHVTVAAGQKVAGENFGQRKIG